MLAPKKTLLISTHVPVYLNILALEMLDTNIQGVQQNTSRFCFLNFSASYGSENSILDIFQQPFLCRFQKYPFLYYWVKSGLRYCENTAGCSFIKLTFFNDSLIKYLSTHEPS